MESELPCVGRVPVSVSRLIGPRVLYSVIKKEICDVEQCFSNLRSPPHPPGQSGNLGESKKREPSGGVTLTLSDQRIPV